MIYTKKSPALLVIGVLMLVWGYLNNSGAVDGMQSWLQKSAYSDHLKATEKFEAEKRVATEMATAENKPAPLLTMPKSRFDSVKAEQAQLSYVIGGLFAALGLLILVWTPKEGDLDYYLGVVPGTAFIVGIAFAVRWGLDPVFANWGKSVKEAGILSWDFARCS